MTQADFDYWVGILRTHHPEHRALSKLGTTFFPRLPKDAEAIKQAQAGGGLLSRIWNQIINRS